MPTIRFLRENRDVQCEVGVNLRELVLKEGLDLYGFKGKIGNCGGFGQCATCLISIEKEGAEALTPRTEVEEKMLKRHPNHWRLACQALVQASAVVLTKPQSPPPKLKTLIQEANQKNFPR